jgi:predicted Zn-dependent peptidase
MPDTSGLPTRCGQRMYHVTQLKNGLTVATAEMPHMMSVSVGLWIGVGSRYGPAQLNGVCHLHTLRKGLTCHHELVH